MNKKNISDFGNEIRDSVKSSIDSGDYQKMGQEIGNTVNNALDAAFREVHKAMDSVQTKTQTTNTKANDSQHERCRQRQTRSQTRRQAPKTTSFKHVPVGKASGILLTLFGTLGIAFFGAGVLFFGIFGFSPQMLSAVWILLIISTVLQMEGTNIRNRLRRYRIYLNLFEGRSSCTIAKLSEYSGYTEKYLLKDLKRMISVGMFPHAKFDMNKTLIMLTRERYELYLEQLAELKELHHKEHQNKSSQNKKNVKTNKTNKNNSPFEEGNHYIEEINAAKLAIDDVVVSGKVQRMEVIVSKIIEHVEENPKKQDEVRRFMKYYLPETIKLLNAYREFDRQPIQGENITTGKNEIASALDTLNQAFENLFDSLFESAMMDVSTDISVLNTILSQEGLAEPDFYKSEDTGGIKQ